MAAPSRGRSISGAASGSLLVDRLGRSEKWRNLAPLRFDDYLDADDLFATLERGALDDVRTVFHLGACSSTTETDASYLMRNNVDYTRRLAEWTLGRGARFVYASSAATYGALEGELDESVPLGRAAAAQHVRLLEASLRSATPSGSAICGMRSGLKYFNVFGPNEDHKADMRSMVHKAFHQIRETGRVRLFRSHRPEFADGEQRRDFVYVKDAVAMTLHLAAEPSAHGLYNIGAGVAHTWIDLGDGRVRRAGSRAADRLRRHAGRAARQVPVLDLRVDWASPPQRLHRRRDTLCRGHRRLRPRVSPARSPPRRRNPRARGSLRHRLSSLASQLCRGSQKKLTSSLRQQVDALALRLLDEARTRLGTPIRRVLLLPPDLTRAHSGAGRITETLYRALAADLRRARDPDARPARAAHRGREPLDVRVDSARADSRRTTGIGGVTPVGTIPASLVEETTGGVADWEIPVHLNTMLMTEPWDLIVNVGHVVPHEVLGFANHNKNYFIGLGGKRHDLREPSGGGDLRDREQPGQAGHAAARLLQLGRGADASARCPTSTSRW